MTREFQTGLNIQTLSDKRALIMGIEIPGLHVSGAIAQKKMDELKSKAGGDSKKLEELVTDLLTCCY